MTRTSAPVLVRGSDAVEADSQGAAKVSEESQRPNLRERLFHVGPESLSTVELVAILLGTGTARFGVRELALQLLGDKGLDAPSLRDIDALRRSVGIGDAKAARLLAALELGRRAQEVGLGGRRIESIEDVAKWARPRLARLEHEELWLLCLDAKNTVKAEVMVARGGALGCSLLPADILRPAVRNGASALILVHNHPSGDATPSRDDLRMTRALGRACRQVGVTLLDHVVVARSGASSIAEIAGGCLDEAIDK
jgi:DNA repair protein RadC